MLSLVSKIRPGWKELPVIIEGDRKELRSAYSEQSGITDKDLAIKLRTESCLQVYLPSSVFKVHLATRYNML